MLNSDASTDDMVFADASITSGLESTGAYFVEPVPAGTKWSFITRNVPMNDIAMISAQPRRQPEPGDLILAEVRKIAQHTRIQLRDGRRSLLYLGDKVIVSYGNRYAPDQFEAVVPTDLDECHLVAAGGIAAKAISKHGKLKWPTSLQPHGYCLDASGQPINLGDYSVVPSAPSELPRKCVVAVVGTSMNSGKTTTVASLVRGLALSGFRVAAIKATGIGSGNDVWAYEDAGARVTLDFTDAGLPSTYLVPQDDIQRCFLDLLENAQARDDVDVIVVEIADGLLHFETIDLISSLAFRRSVDHVLFAAGESMGAVAGVDRLRASGIRPTAVSGVVSASRLAATEAETATGIPVLTKQTLESRAIRTTLGL
ncbi:MAG: molybdopterin-guanine dinucleotide biosynthesis protein MobB [Pseudomonadota bacterium]